MVKSALVKTSEFVTQAEAAKLRGVSVAAINDLVRSGRLKSFPMFGRNLLKRADVLAFEALKPGRKKARRTKAVKKAIRPTLKRNATKK